MEEIGNDERQIYILGWVTTDLDLGEVARGDRLAVVTGTFSIHPVSCWEDWHKDLRGGKKVRVTSTLRARRELANWDEDEDRRQSEIREGLNDELKLNPGDKKSFVVRRGRTEYLAAYDTAHRGAAYTIYMYDAYRFKELIMAKRAVLSLMEPGQEWAIFIFNKLNGDLQKIWARTAKEDEAR